MPGQFLDLTRQIWQQRESFTRPAAASASLAGGGYGTPMVYSRSHLLARTWLEVIVKLPSGGTVVLPAANRSYLCDYLRRVIFRLNVGGTLFDVSGRGLCAGIMPYLESEYFNSQVMRYFTATALDTEPAYANPYGTDSSGAEVVGPFVDLNTLTLGRTYKFFVVIPHMFNLRDPRGLIPLQNPELHATLTIDYESESALGFTLSPAATFEGTVTVIPHLELFTLPIPDDPENPGDQWPDFSVVQMFLEEDKVLTANAPTPFDLARGGIYEQLVLLVQAAKVGATSNLKDTTVSALKLRVMQTDYVMDISGGNAVVVDFFSMIHQYYQGVLRLGGTFPFDFMRSSGLGNYGVPRDLLNMLAVTDVQVVPTATAADTMTVVSRLLVPLATPLYPPRGG